MHLKFASVDEKYIKDQVKKGFYTSETELVKNAVRHFREEEEKKARFYAAVKVGDDQISRGETVLLTDELVESLGKRAIEQAKKGKKPNPDVTP